MISSMSAQSYGPLSPTKVAHVCKCTRKTTDGCELQSHLVVWSVEFVVSDSMRYGRLRPRLAQARRCNGPVLLKRFALLQPSLDINKNPNSFVTVAMPSEMSPPIELRTSFCNHSRYKSMFEPLRNVQFGNSPDQPSRNQGACFLYLHEVFAS